MQPEDAIQGSIANSWIQAAASSIAKKPERLKEIFLIGEKNSANVYALKMYALGVPITVTIDDHIPLGDDGRTIYAQVSPDGAIWGPILEKAVAKLLRNYEALDTGSTGDAMEMLAGGPHKYLWHANITVDKLWETIYNETRNDSMITAGSFEGSDIT